VTPRAESLYRSLMFRLEALELAVQSIRSQRFAGRAGLEAALDVVALYPGWVRSFVKRLVRRTTGDETLLTNTLGLVAVEVSFKADFVEQWFADDAAVRTPLALVEAVERECIDLKLGARNAVIAVGHANNFRTQTPDLEQYLFDRTYIVASKPAGLKKQKFAMIQVPRLEGGEGLWWPLVLGHELAHLVCESAGPISRLDLSNRIVWKDYPEVTVPARRSFMENAENWATELLCDAYCVHRFGPAGGAAIVELLDVLGSTSLISNSHPPGWLRYQMIGSWLGGLDGSVMKPSLAACTQIRATPAPAAAPEYGRLMTLFQSMSSVFMTEAASWLAKPYDIHQREPVVTSAIEDLRHGVPPRPDTGGGLTEEDAVNAGWAEWTRGSQLPVPKLVAKALDTLSFVRHWTQAGGAVGLGEQPDPSEVEGVVPGAAIVAKASLTWRDEHPLVVTPLLPFAVGTASLDLRLGPKFIVFQRTDTASIKTFDPDWDARQVQRRVEVGWGERFILHPNELVLASTLEYFYFPADLSGQVVTRSSYGRMGLISATAVTVHPHFRGCLTLELVNLGLVPLELCLANESRS
jgi:deoxycytidine triphosphate deaminase